MPDPIVDAPIEQTAKLVTQSQLHQDLERFENTPPPAAPLVTDPSASAPPPITNNDIPPADPAATPPPAAEPNKSSFSLSLGDDTPPVTSDVTPPAAAKFNIDEEIKKIDRKELLKKAGVTDFAIEMDDYLSKGGKAEDYLNAKSIDYNKISDEDLVKADLRKEYPGFSKEDIDELFLAKYKDIDAVDPNDPDRKRAELTLRADGYKARQSKIEQQQKFKIPETPILQKNEAFEQWQEQQKNQAQLNEQGKQWFLQHDATKALNESKRVVISLGEGVDPFNFDIDKPEVITQTLTDDGTIWNKILSTKTGEPDVQKRQLVTLFAFNPQQFINDIFKYGMQMGERKPVIEGQNAHKPGAIIASLDPKAEPTYKLVTPGQK